MRHVFSLLAQSRSDADRFIAAANRAGARLEEVIIHPDESARVELQFTSPVEREHLDDILSCVLPTALMRRTLRNVPREANSMTFGPSLALAS